ncbi:optomotor-blind protein [Caerostris darwini]|uniref:Optomotor-blind protein n=1 Tax=Caerostris darwini TaxID=1538125 RepID=A0AAV4VD45_9ARAC|nr:optomotor-blind protein [Caerostris darwini]
MPGQFIWTTKVSATECDRRPGMPHPHLLPYLYPPALYSSSMNHLPLSQLFLPGVTCSSGPSHPLPLSLFTSSGPSICSSFLPLIWLKLAEFLFWGVGSLPSMGHNLLLNAQLAFCCRSLHVHGYPPSHALDGSLPTGASGNGSLLATAGTVGGKLLLLYNREWWVTIPRPTYDGSSGDLFPPPQSQFLNKLGAVSPPVSDCGSSDGSVGPSSVSSSSDLKNIETW